MTTRITVNGVAYDRVDDMPPDVRRVYDETMAKLPGLLGGGGSLPQVTHRKAGPLELTTSVQKMVIVNGKVVGGDAAIPADVRAQLEQAMRAAGTSGTTVKKGEVKASFQVAPSAQPAPIEPAPVDGRIRFAIVFGVCLVALALWLLAKIP